MTGSALGFSERIETRKSVITLENERVSIEKQIQNAQEMDGNADQITRDYLEKKSLFTRIREDLNKQRSFLTRLKQVLESRVNSTHNFTVKCNLLLG